MIRNQKALGMHYFLMSHKLKLLNKSMNFPIARLHDDSSSLFEKWPLLTRCVLWFWFKWQGCLQWFGNYQWIELPFLPLDWLQSKKKTFFEIRQTDGHHHDNLNTKWERWKLDNQNLFLPARCYLVEWILVHRNGKIMFFPKFGHSFHPLPYSITGLQCCCQRVVEFRNFNFSPCTQENYVTHPNLVLKGTSSNSFLGWSSFLFRLVTNLLFCSLERILDSNG